MVRSREPGLDHADFAHDDQRRDDADTRPGISSRRVTVFAKGATCSSIVACTKSMSASMPSTLVSMVRKRDVSATESNAVVARDRTAGVSEGTGGVRREIEHGAGCRAALLSWPSMAVTTVAPDRPKTL